MRPIKPLSMILLSIMDKKKYNAEYYSKNRAAILAQVKKKRQENPEKVNLKNRKYYHTNDAFREKIQAKMRAYKRNWRLEKEYGLTEEQYLDILRRQDGRCAICKTEEWGGHRNMPHIDHDHLTGKVRGILCGSCNRALGMFKESLDIIKSAHAYLQKHG